MRHILNALCLGTAVAVLSAGIASANDELAKLQQDPKQWAQPAGNFANTRYSALKQITADNVGKLQVAWTFSTGVLRGHEGGPLVIGDMMYVHTPFPNIVYALDLNDDGKIKWKYEPKQDPNVIPVMCCDTVNRGVAYPAGDGKIYPASGRHDARRARTPRPAKSRVVGEDGDPGKGETGTSRRWSCKDKVISRRLGRRVRRAGLRDRLQSEGRQAGMARLFDGSRQRTR